MSRWTAEDTTLMLSYLNEYKVMMTAKSKYWNSDKFAQYEFDQETSGEQAVLSITNLSDLSSGGNNSTELSEVLDDPYKPAPASTESSFEITKDTPLLDVTNTLNLDFPNNSIQQQKES